MANTLVVNAKNCEQEEYAVALHQVAALSAKPVVRPEQDPLPESSSKLAAHSHQRSAEHHVGLAPVVHKRSPSSVLGAHSEASQSTWSHRPSRTAAARHVTIQPLDAKRSMYHVRVLLPYRVANIRLAHVGYKLLLCRPTCYYTM